MNDHPTACRCSLHRQLESRRQNAYRQLALAILGPDAPREDLALARALAEHAGLSQFPSPVVPFRPRRAA